MALIKNRTEAQKEALTCDSIESCCNIIREGDDFSERASAIDEIIKMDRGAKVLVAMLKEGELEEKTLISHVCANLSRLDPKIAPIDEILELLKIENAFVRNHAISILQDYGKEIKYYIVKYLIGDDRDLRIFAINVLGDVKFSESREMLLELLQKEHDINVAMTAVDYLREIGAPEDIPFLEGLKKRFKDEPYVDFAIAKTIKAIKG